MNSPLLARPAYGSFVLCSRDESGTASRTKPFIGNSWRYFSELCSVLDTTFIGAMHRIGVETSYAKIEMDDGCRLGWPLKNLYASREELQKELEKKKKGSNNND